MADEVGLGKTIEAGLVLCEYWAERKRRLLVICPASLRKQWALEMEEKFNLPTLILEARSARELSKQGVVNPFDLNNKVVITSFNYASRFGNELRSIPFDFVVIDEAHKLRNAYRPSNKMGQNIRWAVEERKKALLTATPLQNSLLELYGLSTIIDERIFGDLSAFRTQYTTSNADLEGLRNRIVSVCKRTLRSQVLEYIQYTERRPITRHFRPTDNEQKLYEAISDFLLREDTYSIPSRQRQLITLVLRKLLSSSSRAIAGTLETIKDRLISLRAGLKTSAELLEELIEEDELEEEYLDLETETQLDEEEAGEPEIDPAKLDAEIEEVGQLARWARSIEVDSKARTLLSALEIGFEEMGKMGAARKALIFTESRRTQEFVKNFLDANGYAGKIVSFSGTNTGDEPKAIYERWLETNKETGRISGSRAVDIRTALVEHFRDHAEIMIATEAGAEGINMQFCSMVVNYDLPWNPQRIEQRIGRCHRYGQKHDVVVINFLNERNEADQRVYQLLDEKFNLFRGVFGASDEVLGTIESGVDFEKRILEIYEQCRTHEEIQAAFEKLQEEMEATIQSRMEDTRRLLFEHFDEDVHNRLRMQLDDTRQQLDRFGKMFWETTKVVLDGSAMFNEEELAFTLTQSPVADIPGGYYHLISKDKANVPGQFLYRLSHPLGEHVIDTAKELECPVLSIAFDITKHPTRISLVEALKGKNGWLILNHLRIESLDEEEYLLFSGIDSEGRALDPESLEKLFQCRGRTNGNAEPDEAVLGRLQAESKRLKEATITRSLEMNNRHFEEERDKLEKWAEDMVLGVERELKDTKEQIKVLNREARKAETTDEQHALQSRIKDMEKSKRRLRERIFDVEDEIAEKRDQLIARLEKRLAQKTETRPLFTIHWTVV